MKILIILVDYISEREPFFDNAREILSLCKTSRLKACIAAHSVTNIFYILRREIPENERRKILKYLCKLLTVVSVNKSRLITALDNSDFKDMEDCLQVECAKTFRADYIVTRNIKDFEKSTVPAVTPEEFLIRFSGLS